MRISKTPRVKDCGISFLFLQQQYKASGEQPDTMSRREAAMFPFISSFTLVGLYILYKVVGSLFYTYLAFKSQVLSKVILFLGIREGVCESYTGWIFLFPWYFSFVSSYQVNYDLGWLKIICKYPYTR